jgi:hypothetical protein
MKTRGANIFLLFVLTSALLGSGPAAAQTVRGSIGGVVKDASGGVVPAAKIVLKNQDTGQAREVVADASGEFVFLAVPAGNYRVEITKAGFQAFTYDALLSVNQSLRSNVALQLGAVRGEPYLVVDSLATVRTDSATGSTVIDNRQVTQLPLDGRNFFELSLLAPGTAPAAQGSAGSVRGDFAIHVGGNREDSNLFLLDGVYNGDPKLNGIGVNPPVDAVQEFEVLTGNYDASFGRNAGAQVNVALKSGTNDLHGTLYAFTRNAAFDARNRFAPAGEPAPKYLRNQFGFTLGGPIRRDRTFFFGDYEGRIVREGVTRLTNVPTEAERAGDFSNSLLPVPNIPGFGPMPVIPSFFQHPVGQALAALYPLPNRATPGANFVSSPTLRDNEHHFDVRMDHALSSRSELSVRYSFVDRELFEPFSGAGFALVPGFGNTVPRRAQNLMVSETHVFSPVWINEARFAFHRVAIGVNQQGQGTSLNQQAGLPDISSNPRDFGLSFIRLTGFSPLGHEYNNPQASVSNTFQFMDHVSYVRGAHSMRFGGEIRALQQNGFRDVQSRGILQFLGVFTGNPLADLLLGLPTVTGVAQLDNPQHLRAESYAAFFHESYRVRPNLTLTAGVRYEYTSPPVDTNDRATVYDAASGQLAPVGTAGVPRSGHRDDRNNIGPRVGIAWSPGSGNTVLRAGYGIYFDQSALAPGEGLYFNAPYFDFRLFFSLPPDGLFPGYTLTLTDPFPVSTFPLSLPASALTFQRDLRTPYVQHWSLSIQRRLGSTRSLEVAYVGAKGTHLVSARDINQPAPSPVSPNLRPNPLFDDITAVESRSSSIYHALQTRYQQRIWCGMTMLASYTLAKSIDDASGFFASAGDPNFPQDSNNVRAERARSNFDVRQRFSLGYTYDIPLGPLARQAWAARVLGGWQTNGIVVLQSGRPFSVALLPELDNSNTGRSILGFGANDRPNITGAPALSNPTPGQWFDTSAYSMPAFGTFGNAGRNQIEGPGLAVWNVSLVKSIQAAERVNVQFRTEIFNLFNRTNLDQPDAFLGSPTFGQVLSAQSPRRMQFGLKVVF